MRLQPSVIYLGIISLVALTTASSNNYQQDNEFAEFEDFESDDDALTPFNEDGEFLPSTHEHLTIGNEDDQDVVDIMDEDDDEEEEDDDAEFEHFQDKEEFEGFDTKEDAKPASEPKIMIANVPIHFRDNWDSYWMEILMVTGLVVYFVNFATGKSKNTKIANVWLQTHRTLLEDNFLLVGKKSWSFIIYLGSGVIFVGFLGR